MPVYLIPAVGEPSDLTAVCSRAGVPLLTPAKVRDFLLMTNENPHSVCRVDSKILLILSRHANELLVDLPAVVHAVPGCVYDPDWMTLAAAFPAIDVRELLSKMEKSGVLASTPFQMEERDRGAADTPMEIAGNGFVDDTRPSARRPNAIEQIRSTVRRSSPLDRPVSMTAQGIADTEELFDGDEDHS